MESVCLRHPDEIVLLFDSIDLERGGLERVSAAVTAGDLPTACRELVEYYKTCDSGNWYRIKKTKSASPALSPSQPVTNPKAERLLNDTFEYLSVEARVPRTEDGGLDWTYNGPDGDREWGWSLNSHDGVTSLLEAYLTTGNVAYVRRLDEFVRDWVENSPYPGRHSRTGQWRGLQASARVRRWDRVFYALQDVEEFTPAARILMLSSLLDHADFLRRYHAERGNWLANEMSGLATIAVTWPEFEKASAWFDYANGRMKEEINNQVYPDGAQKELTAHYNLTTAFHFRTMLEVIDRSGRRVDPELASGVERLWNYLAWTVRPDGNGPLNNDSDLINMRPHVSRAATKWGRSDWIYVVTNGREGSVPAQQSVLFPWAGHVVMRSGWDGDARWSFFDIGPAGIAHRHNDKLHLSVSAYGRDLLVDSGRYIYASGQWRRYFSGSQSHNVLLVDGSGQNQGPPENLEPVPEETSLFSPRFDYAAGTFSNGFEGVEGTAEHTRAVMFVKNGFWIVVDRINTDRPRDVQVLWHYHPDCTVEVQGDNTVSTDAGLGNLRITPAGNMDWSVRIVKGRETPDVQGWYSPGYNHKVPSPAAIYSTDCGESATFVWVLTPARGPVPLVDAVLESAGGGGVSVRVTFAGGRTISVFIPLAGGTPRLD